MKNWFIIISGLFILLNFSLYGQDVLGDESIEPLRYHKFSVSGGYPFERKFHGFGHESLRVNLESRPYVGLIAEAGLVKYFNAGVQYTFGIPDGDKEEPIWMELSLFAKPYLPLGSRVSIFSRLNGGLGFSFFEMEAVEHYVRENFKTRQQSISQQEYLRAYGEIYKDQTYEGWSWGGYGSATIGIEFFPLKRFGIAVEAGVRAYLLRKEKKWLFVKPSSKYKDAPGTPSGFNYMLYDFPIMVTLQAIL